jgi:chromosome partitioning protein
MARVICIANQKGGVGKTTTSVNLSSALANLNRRVLIVDLDPQGNASSGLGLKRYDNQKSNIYHVLVGEKTISQVAQTTQVTNLKVATANPDLVGAEIELVDMPRREYRLKDALNLVADEFDYIIIDCPPSLGLLTVNALSAADSFLVPLQCEYYALEGLSQLLNTAGMIKKNLNPQLKIEGIVLTMFDARNNLSHQVVSEIQSHFGDKVFSAIIPRNVRLSEAPSHGQSIFAYDAKSVGAKKYLELATELDARVKALTKVEAEVEVENDDLVMEEEVVLARVEDGSQLGEQHV